MKKFLRSSKSSSEQPRSQPRQPVAIGPPKKVIAATQAFRPSAAQKDFIPFQEGDFFHVIGLEDDKHFYEVEGLKGIRGKVPRVYFEDVERGSRPRTQHSEGPPQDPQAHDSGFAEGDEDSYDNRSSVGGAEAAEAARKQSMSSARSGKAGTMIYGIISFDFKAERPDELEARAGEKIMVIAQSNPEWFVAKPIERLGGPGLIPVSFVSLRYTNDGSEVANPVEAVRAAGVPRVEEWKSRAAWYKNNSVPLGRLESRPPQDSQQNLPDSMSRLSVGTGASRRSYDHQHDQNSRASQYSQTTLSHPSNELLHPTSGHVAGYARDPDTKEFYYRVEVNYSQGISFALRRTYKQFFDLQNQFFKRYPSESGQQQGHDRIIPTIPGPMAETTIELTAQRLPYMDNYVRTVLQLPAYISNSELCRSFFSPHGEDERIEPLSSLDRDSNSSQQSQPANMYSQNQGYPSTQSLNSSSGPSYGSPQRRQPPTQIQQQQYPSQQQPYRTDSPYQQDGAGHQRTNSALRPPNGVSNGLPHPMQRNDSAITARSQTSLNSAITNPSPSTIVKVKVFLAENCILLRLPSTFTYADLAAKVRERWLLEPGVDKSNTDDLELGIDFRDEQDNQFYTMRNEEELRMAVERNEKLTIRVRAL